MSEQCGARTKAGTPCKSKPVEGAKRCRLHGGLGGRPPTHGRYSGVLHNRLKTLIDKHGEIEDPLNLLDELALLRALVEDYINRYEEITEALLAWHSDILEREEAKEIRIVENPKPPRILDLADSYRLISEVSKIVKRIEDVKANNAISQKDFFRLIEQMGVAVKNHVDDEKTRKKIAGDWGTLRY